MKKWLILALLTPALATAQKYQTSDGKIRVAPVKMPYSGARNVPELSGGPDYLQEGGMVQLIEEAGGTVKPIPTVGPPPSSAPVRFVDVFSEAMLSARGPTRRDHGADHRLDADAARAERTPRIRGGLFEESGEARWNRPAITEMLPNLRLDSVTRSVISDGWKLVRFDDAEEPRFELYQHRDDPLNLNDVADEHPEIVERLAEMLDNWRDFAKAARLDDEAATSGMDSAERLRSLGYIQ